MPKNSKVQVGYLYKTDGTTEKIFPENGKKFELSELQRAVGGYIERLIPGIKNCRQMFCNEDGEALSLPPNPHTWDVVNQNIYRVNHYSPEWRVLGNILAVLTEERTK